MNKLLTRLAKKLLINQDYAIIHNSQFRSDLPDWFWESWSQVQDWTLTSPERGLGLAQAVTYIEQQTIPGDIVECGVYKGGSAMLAALTLLRCNPTPIRKLWLYDTFEGMPRPSTQDRISATGQPVAARWHEGWWKSPVSEVKRGMSKTGYPMNLVSLIKGNVLQTLEESIPEKIALLRLDTDWYESTKKELEVLYPLLAPGGVLIIDDYGHFTGARQAVDEYFSTQGQIPLLHRLDYTGRLMVKPA
jgi:hypothetical protein